MNKKWLIPILLLILSLGLVSSCYAEQLFKTQTASQNAAQYITNTVDHSDFNGSIILGRAEDKSVTASITTPKQTVLYLEWGATSGTYPQKSQEYTSSTLTPAVIVMEGLMANTAYYYHVVYKPEGESDYKTSNEYSFQTARNSGSNYNFVIQSDSHLLNKADPTLYAKSMQTMAGLKPDFICDLGDTFLNDQKMDALTQSYDNVVKTVTQQLPYFDIVTRSAPLLLTIGNHEGEYGAYLDGTANNLAAKATMARTTFFPNPVPDDFYTGNTQTDTVCGQPQDYYAFTWGDALYVTIDPYRYSSASPESIKDGWEWSLGKTQYDWFRNTLETSNAKYKFVFSHHAIGNMRGGEVIANLYEWGGYDKKGQYLFDQKRPGWGKPIQQIMKDTGVTIFFQGHDHLFAREVVDGVVYQTLPKPAEITADKQSNFGAYPSGDVLLNSGFLNITVNPENVQVDYNRSYFVSSGSQEGNTGVVYSYTVNSAHQVQVLKSTEDDLSTYYGNTTDKFVFDIEADPHLDENTDVNLYRQTLNNIAADKPEYLIDLGDTSMVEKFAKTESEVISRFQLVKSYFNLLGNIPIYPVTGNHDGESAWDANINLQTWARAARQTYLPMPGGLTYTGNTTTANYYTFIKGDAQFIVLDPYTYSLQKARGDSDGWNYTLGKTQYDWLVNTLENSTAKYKFVFIHNLVGGEGKDARGGAEAAKLFEWGGYNADGTYGFDQMRSGWGKPIHQLLLDYGVKAVFHGHDHFYDRQILDGITYQLVPQPGTSKNSVLNAAEYGYESGTILPSAGHLRVTVTSMGTSIEYIRSSTAPAQNRVIADKYNL